jgi:Flp pilus assembly pilin Flp
VQQLHRIAWRIRFRFDEFIGWLGSLADTALVRARSERGQTVAEYALVLLVVAAIAVAFLVWAKSSGRLDAFFNKVFDKLVNSVDANPSPTP